MPTQVIAPAAIYINGQKIDDPGKAVSLKAGANPILIRLDSHGEAHLVLRKQGVAASSAKAAARYELVSGPRRAAF